MCAIFFQATIPTASQVPHSSGWVQDFKGGQSLLYQDYGIYPGRAVGAIKRDTSRDLYHRILQYTTTPTLAEYKAVCTALVTEFPSLIEKLEALIVSSYCSTPVGTHYVTSLLVA